MSGKTVDLKELNSEDKAKYHEYVKFLVKEGDYFKDATDWYFLKYVTPFCHRTLLIFAAIISIVVLFYLYGMIQIIYPLKEEVPIYITAKDQSLYFPHLVSLNLKQDPDVSNVDEAVAKYLLSVYVKDREGYDYSKARIEDINTKFRRLKNTSSPSQYREFQMFMSKDNSDSPIYQFGKEVSKEIKIKSVVFDREKEKNATSKASRFLKFYLPSEAKVYFTANTYSTKEDVTKKDSQDYVAHISFDFGGANKTKEKVPVQFMVNNYQLFKIKK